MATALKPGGHEEGFAKTQRTDAWWLGPGVTFLVFTGFLIYGTWAAFQNAHYWVGGENPEAFGGYLSPFYSPPLFLDPVDAARADTTPMSHHNITRHGLWHKDKIERDIAVIPALEAQIRRIQSNIKIRFCSKFGYRSSISEN